MAAAAIRGTILATIFLAAVSAASAEELTDTRVGWSDQAEFSFVDTSGNTDMMSVSGKNLLMYRFATGSAAYWKVSGLRSEEEGRKSAMNLATELRFDRACTGAGYGYVLGGWNRDRFAGFDHRYYGGVGVGYKLLDGPKHFLAAEGGINLSKEDYIDGSESSFFSGRAFTKYEYSISEKSKFAQSLEFLYDFSDSSHFRVNAETAVVSSLTDVLSLKAGYTVRYENEPVPSTLEKTDTFLSLTLVVNL